MRSINIQAVQRFLTNTASLLAAFVLGVSLSISGARAEEQPDPANCTFVEAWQHHSGQWKGDHFEPPRYFSEALDCWLSRLNLEDQNVRVVIETYLMPGVPVLGLIAESDFSELEAFSSLSHTDQASISVALLASNTESRLENEWPQFFNIRTADERRVCTWNLAILANSSEARHGIQLPATVFNTHLQDCMRKRFDPETLEEQLQETLGASRSDFDFEWLSMLIEARDGLLRRRERVFTETCAPQNRNLLRPTVPQAVLCD